MSVANPNPADFPAPAPRPGQTVTVAGGRSAGGIVAMALIGFVILWMVFHTVALAPVDLRDDASEAALWARQFAFGYKHPPLTAWLFMLWFSIFPRADWAMHLEAVTLAAAALAIAWPLLRDYLDTNRALLGLASLILIPLYTVKAEELNANTVMMPFWAAALLFYLRARRGLGIVDAALAGAFASLAFLGKYWAIYLLAGMAVAAVTGPGTRRFWRSPAPYVMAASALVVVAPHLYWYASQVGGTNYAFMRDSVMTDDSFGTVLAKSAYYLLGVIAYAAGPLLLLALLRPSRTALADIVWPAGDNRRQALILFVVPMALPALVNLVAPYRLTPDWTFPNWTLLPVVLYASRRLIVDRPAAKVAATIAAAASLACLAAAPFMASAKVKSGLDSNRPSSHQVAAAAVRLADPPPLLYWGSTAIIGNLPFYLTGAHPLLFDPQSADGRSEIAADGLLIVCLKDDAACLTTQSALAGNHARAADFALTRSFLGFAGAPIGYRLTALSAQGH